VAASAKATASSVLGAVAPTSTAGTVGVAWTSSWYPDFPDPALPSATPYPLRFPPADVATKPAVGAPRRQPTPPPRIASLARRYSRRWRETKTTVAEPIIRITRKAKNAGSALPGWASACDST
jgi:hypothetical protein